MTKMIWNCFLQPPTWVTCSESPAANLESSSQGARPPSYSHGDCCGDDDDVARVVYHIVAFVSQSQPAVLRKINSKSFFSPQSKPPTAALLQCLQLPPKEAKGGQNSKVGPKVAKEATHSLPRDRQKAKGLQDCRRLN